jgi:hypothetical protein
LNGTPFKRQERKRSSTYAPRSRFWERITSTRSAISCGANHAIEWYNQDIAVSHPPTDQLDDDDLAAIDESEDQIARGQDLDWKDASAQLRKKFLAE